MQQYFNPSAKLLLYRQAFSGFCTLQLTACPCNRIGGSTRVFFWRWVCGGSFVNSSPLQFVFRVSVYLSCQFLFK